MAQREYPDHKSPSIASAPISISSPSLFALKTRPPSQTLQNRFELNVYISLHYRAFPGKYGAHVI